MNQFFPQGEDDDPWKTTTLIGSRCTHSNVFSRGVLMIVINHRIFFVTESTLKIKKKLIGNCYQQFPGDSAFACTTSSHFEQRSESAESQ